MIDIVKKAISLLIPTPPVNFDWVKSGDKNIYVIKTEKADNVILLNNKKYIREKGDSILENALSTQKTILNAPVFNKTIAIIIAIENYAPNSNISKVKYANNDAIKFKEVLINKMNVAEEDITIFINEQALQNHLEYDFLGLFHSLTENDRLIFYYVGHGFHNGITNFLSTYDMHKHHIAGTSISLRQILLDPLRKSKCRNALIFIDACAKIFQDQNERNQISDIDKSELELLNTDFPNYSIFLSCQTGESSYSSDILQNGIWTHHLVCALNGNVEEVIYSGKYITDRLLSDYLSTNVREYTKEEQQKEQNPRSILDSSHENVIIEII